MECNDEVRDALSTYNSTITKQQTVQPHAQVQGIDEPPPESSQSTNVTPPLTRSITPALLYQDTTVANEDAQMVCDTIVSDETKHSAYSW